MVVAIALLACASSLAPTQYVRPASAVLFATTTYSDIHNATHNHVTGVILGTKVHMWVRVVASGTKQTPTGSVVVRRYANQSCSGDPASTVSATLDGGEVDVLKSTYTTVAPTIMSFRASYRGSTSFAASQGGCHPLGVIATAQVAYTFHDPDHRKLAGDFLIGTDVHPRVTVSGAWGVPAGIVHVHMYYDAPTEPPCSLPYDDISTSLVNGSYDATGIHLALQQPGKAWVQTRYLGDGVTYTVNEGPCVAIWWKAQAQLSAAVRDLAGAIVSQVQVGNDVLLTAAMGGAFGVPTGSVRFRFWDASSCSGAATTTRNVALDTHGKASTQLTMSTAGTKAYQVTFLGDSNYLTRDLPCRTFSVTAAATATPTAPATATPTAPATATPTSMPGTTSAPAATQVPGTSPGSSQGTATLGPDATDGLPATGQPSDTGGSGVPTLQPGSSGGSAATTAPSPAPASSVGGGTVDIGLLIVLLVLGGIVLLVVGVAVGLRLSRRPRASS
jgi:hypothetical protein